MSGSEPAVHNTPERRANPRTRLQKLAYIRVEPDNGAIVVDAGSGGIRFYAVAPLHQNGDVQFSFSLSGNRRVEAAARLAWTDATKKSGGLEFSSVPAEVVEQILNCCLAQAFKPHNDRKLPEVTSNDPTLSERLPMTLETPVILPESKEGHSSLTAGQALAAGEISRAEDQQADPPNGVRSGTPLQPEVEEVHSNGSCSVTQLTQADFRVDVMPHESQYDPEARKKLTGKVPVAARLSTLPPKKLSRSVWASRPALRAFVLVILSSLTTLFLTKVVTNIRDGAVPAIAPTNASAASTSSSGRGSANSPAGPDHAAQKQLAPHEAKSAESRGREALGTNHNSTKEPNKDAEIGYFGSGSIPGGTGDDNGAGGADGVRDTAASAVVGNGVAVSPPGDPGIPDDGPKTSVFASSTDESESPKSKANDTAALPVQPLVILDKPSPVYTEEARRLAIEGEVLIEVIFSASGQVHIVRVVRGLGHGLDEAATSAVQQIRFEPALQNGQPVDVPATVHITFQLAF